MATNDPDQGRSTRWRRPFHFLWNILRFLWGVVIFGLFINILATWLTSTSNFIPGSPIGWLLAHSLLTGIIGTGLLLLTLCSGIVTARSALPHTTPMTPTQQNRFRMLKILHVYYKNGLARSLSGNFPLPLSLRTEENATRMPPAPVLRHAPQPKQQPVTWTSIQQVYDESGHGLVILGAPGSGKSTLLLDLASILLQQAEGQDTQPIPVIFNLTSWVTKQLPLDRWLVEELLHHYQVPRGIGYTWVQSDQILPLLDGLDEVGGSIRSACIAAINTYLTAHFMPLVICCRDHDYFAQNERIALSSAVVVQPLTQDQITAYLNRQKKSMTAVREALHSNPVLYELITTPLMLIVVTTTYQGKQAKDLPQMGSPEVQQHQIFANYVERMLEQHGHKKTYSSSQTIRWLSWLAQQMKAHHQNVLYLERLQPDWLSTTERPHYDTVAYHAIAFLYALIVGGIGGLCMGYLSTVAFGFFWLTLASLLSGPMSRRLIEICIRNGHRQRRRRLHSISAPEQGPQESFDALEIQPTERVVWSRELLTFAVSLLFSKAIRIGVVVGLLLCLLFSIFKGLLIGLLAGVIGTGYALFCLLIGSGLGLIGEMVDERHLFTPNQGIHRSALYGLFIGLVSAIGAGLFSGSMTSLLFNSGPTTSVMDGLFCGIWIGCCVWMVSGLLNGWLACLLHVILRWMLWRAGHAPLNYIRFLDNAVERIFLSKNGGGYSFLHPLFRDYFASLPTSQSAPPSK